MSKRFKIGFLGLLVVGALVIAMSGTVLAQEDTPAPESKPFGWHGRGRGFGRALGGQVGLEAAAEALGMDADTLSTQLWGGETLASLAEKAGVDLQDVQDAVTVALNQAKRDAIEQAVEDGNLDPDHGQWLLDGLDKGYLDGPRFGGFCGRGGFGGHGGFRGFPGGNTGFGGFGRFPGGLNFNHGTTDT